MEIVVPHSPLTPSTLNPNAKQSTLHGGAQDESLALLAVKADPSVIYRVLYQFADPKAPTYEVS